MVAEAALAAYNIVKGSIFCYRSFKKGENGQPGRFFISGIQGLGVGGAVASTGSMAGIIAKDTIHSIEKAAAAKGETAVKALNLTKKAVKIGANPYIVANGVLQVAMADNKEEEATKQICGLSTMFLGERLAKDFLLKNNKEILKQTGLINKGFVKGILDFATKYPKGSGIVKGCSFVLASIASFALGAMIGDSINGAVKSGKSVFAS